jgi:hypothetical protein
MPGIPVTSVGPGQPCAIHARTIAISSSGIEGRPIGMPSRCERETSG